MKTVVYRGTHALSQVVQRPVESVAEGRDGRWAVIVSVGGVDHRLELVWAGEGWPADVEEVLAGVPVPWPRQLLVVGRRFSPGALDLLREHDANWVDETGRACIEGPAGLLVIRDAERKLDEVGEVRFRWSSSSVDIAELLLTQPGETINAVEIAERLGWSHAQMTSVLRRFDKEGWTVKVGAGRGPSGVRRLAAAASLLDAWAAHVGGSERERVLTHRVLRDPMSFLREQLAPVLTASMTWAASGWAGLEVAAPFVSAVPVLQIYVPAEASADGRLRTAMQEAGLREVEEGARIEFWTASATALSLVSTTAGVPVVSAPRLYADLRALGGRGEEAAQHVREELVGF
jgi:hypothetical protein